MYNCCVKVLDITLGVMRARMKIILVFAVVELQLFDKVTSGMQVAKKVEDHWYI
jgi:hypothetical protein